MALVEIETSITITDGEIKIQKNIVDMLEPVKLATDGLSSRDATLLAAERIHGFLLKTISTLNSAYLHDIAKSRLAIRIKAST